LSDIGSVAVADCFEVFRSYL